MTRKTIASREIVRETERNVHHSTDNSQTRIFRLQSSDTDNNHTNTLQYFHLFDPGFTDQAGALLTEKLGNEVIGNLPVKHWNSIPGITGNDGHLTIALLTGSITISYTDSSSDGPYNIELIRTLINDIDELLQLS